MKMKLPGIPYFIFTIILLKFFAEIFFSPLLTFKLKKKELKGTLTIIGIESHPMPLKT